MPSDLHRGSVECVVDYLQQEREALELINNIEGTFYQPNPQPRENSYIPPDRIMYGRQSPSTYYPRPQQYPTPRQDLRRPAPPIRNLLQMIDIEEDLEVINTHSIQTLFDKEKNICNK